MQVSHAVGLSVPARPADFDHGDHADGHDDAGAIAAFPAVAVYGFAGEEVMLRLFCAHLGIVTYAM